VQRIDSCLWPAVQAKALSCSLIYNSGRCAGDEDGLVLFFFCKHVKQTTQRKKDAGKKCVVPLTETPQILLLPQPSSIEWDGPDAHAKNKLPSSHTHDGGNDQATKRLFPSPLSQ